MEGHSLPPGFRFHPTEEELIGYYLKRMVQGLEIELEVIPVIKLYTFEPWELPDKSFLPAHDMEWFFFCPRDRKYPNGSRTNRATNAGYWKATGKDRKVLCQSSLLGYRKTLVFYSGRAPFGNRTCWIMHEYRLCDDDISERTPSFQGPFALCRVMKKNEQRTTYVNSGPKKKGVKISESNIMSPLTSFQANEPTLLMSHNDPPSFQVSPNLILESSKVVCAGGEEGRFGYFQQNNIPIVPWQPFGTSPSSSYSNFTEEDELIQFGSMSPYSGDESLMDFFGNEDHDWSSSLGNLKPF